MKIYTFGNRENPGILLLPGTCCHWQANFGAVIPLLTPCFYVMCVSYDGFDETEEDAAFPGMTEETEKIERYIKENQDGHLFAAYGCSLGGSFVGLLLQRKKIHIDHAILGSSDLDQSGQTAAKLKTLVVSPIILHLLRGGKIPGFMEKKLQSMRDDKRDYFEKMMDLFGVGSTRMAFVKKESVRRQFYSDLVTPLADGIACPGTAVHCFYAMKMGKKYLQRYQRHFPEADIRKYRMQHEELLMRYPEAWLLEVEDCCGIDEAAAYRFVSNR